MGVRLRVLMIEDSEDDADLVMRELKRGGYRPTFERVETADAMRAALEKGRWWDIALCDYAMAQFDAPAALVLWQESGSEQPFIVVAGAIGEEVAVVLMKAGVHDYVNKNNLARLAQVIARELRAAETRRANARAEAALRIRDQQLRALFENSSADINIKDAEGRYVFASRQFEKTFGVAKDEAIGKLPHEIFPSEFADVVRAHDLAVLKTGQLIEKEHVIPNGQTVQSVSKFPISDGSGSVVGIGVIAIDITERKRAEDALRIRERQLRAFFRNSSADLNIKDAEGRYVLTSRQFEKTFGLAEGEAIGKLPHEIFPSEFADVLRKRDLSVLQTGQRVDDEQVNPDKYGSTVRLVSKFPISDAEDGIVGLGAFAIDITERKRAEQALRESEERYRTLVESALACIHEIDLHGRLLTMNPAGLRMMGVSEEKEISGSAYLDVVAPGDREHVAALLNRAYEGHASEFEFTAIGNGHPRVFASSFIPIRSDDGSIVKLMGVTQDVTERKRAEEALRASEDRFRSLIENASDVIAIANTDGVITYESPAVERMLGYKPEEYVGKTVFGYMHPDDVPTLVEAYKRLTANPGSVERTVHRHRHKDGSWRILESIRKSIAENGVTKEIVINARDITEHKHAEQELRETVRELARSNADLRQFAHVASHDLQEPLRMVASYTELLRKRYQGKLDADADEFIEFAVDGATRMQGLIEDLLAYSRVGTQGKVFAPTDCQAVFDQVTRNLQVAIEESGATVTHNSLPTVMADETQLVQLFQNLIGNAIKFHGDETPRVHVSVKEDANECVFAVCDNGIGIDREYAERIFIIFKRLHEKDEYPGTGIGLAICKKIMDRHSGRIWVDSESGKGSTFYFALPRERGR